MTNTTNNQLGAIEVEGMSRSSFLLRGALATGAALMLGMSAALGV